MAKCIRCGEETSSTYCVACRGWAESVKALLATAESDAVLLRLVDGDADNKPMRKADIARLLQVTRPAVGQRIARARERQRRRAEFDKPLNAEVVAELAELQTGVQGG